MKQSQYLDSVSHFNFYAGNQSLKTSENASSSELLELVQKLIENNERLKNEISEFKNEIVIVVDDGVRRIIDKIISLEDKIDALQTAQLDAAIIMRQVASDINTDRHTLKTQLATLGESFTEEFSGLEMIKCSASDGVASALSAEDMSRLIETAVQGALKRIQATELTDDIKKVLAQQCYLIIFDYIPILFANTFCHMRNLCLHLTRLVRINKNSKTHN